jgi:hypothetical protein
MKVHTEQESNRLRYAQEKAWQEEKYNTMQKQMTDLQELLKSCPDTILLPRSSETNVTGEPRGARPGGTDTHCKSLEEEAEDLMDEYGEEDSGPEFGSPPPTTTKQVVPIPSNITDSQKKSLDSNFDGANFFSSLNPKNIHYQIGTGRANSPDERAKAKATPAHETFDISGGGRPTRENKSSKEKEYFKFQNLPTVPKFRMWRLRFKRDIASGSIDPKRAMIWITEMESAQSWEELEDDEEFYTLSAKIAAGIIQII